MKELISILGDFDEHWVGNGFFVRSVFDYNGLGRTLNPFLLLDYAAPHTFSPADVRRGVPPHPHRGFETVTLAYAGEIEHRDSGGGGGKIGPGDVQWMTAGGGIIHEEFHSPEFTRSGGEFEMVQLWVNLPAKHKSAPPGYQTLLGSEIPVISLPGESGSVRVIAGEFDSNRGPAKTFTPINVWEISLRAEKAVELPVPEGHVATILVLRGSVLFSENKGARTGVLAVFRREGKGVRVEAVNDAKLLVLSAEPIDEPIVAHGPFVMNTRSEILRAFSDYERGEMGALPEAKT